ncbi:hypothetical protein AX774_g6091 [Zancudomyces culisetae]|uniref:Uncharacterized protein n=1 Tax=Zancudomyces culisetae TaxID=1213189 RepID=A0A1R1PHQ2_ZANCU|nr:hypothetical protein AX774_g6091 [Zancudomyces culisetae]|eukprot:OMH80478.1 hypothetical protein AX774_g6091 [Zancudomyces culisetae]
MTSFSARTSSSLLSGRFLTHTVILFLFPLFATLLVLISVNPLGRCASTLVPFCGLIFVETPYAFTNAYLSSVPNLTTSSISSPSFNPSHSCDSPLSSIYPTFVCCITIV